jgi:CRP-like cAMP-binding protein
MIGKRATTVRASSDVQAYKLDPALFQALLQNHPEIKNYIRDGAAAHRQLSNFIKLYTPLAQLPLEALKLIVIEGEQVSFEDGDLIVRQGDQIGAMFILLEGKLRLFSKHLPNSAIWLSCAKAEPFGEAAL